MKFKYKAIRNATIDSVIISHINELMAFSLTFPFHMIPINNAEIDTNSDSNAIHSAGRLVMISFVIEGVMYVAIKPKTKNHDPIHF